MRRIVPRTVKQFRSLSTAPPAPPPPPPAPKSGSSGVWMVVALGAAGGAYYFQDDLKALVGGKPAATPAPVAKAPTAVPPPSPAPAPVVEKKAEVPKKEELDALEAKLVKPASDGKKKEVDWKAVRERIASVLDDNEWDDGSWGPVFVRLAWHAAGTYDAKTKLGGSEGALMRFKPESEWGANAGLAHARARLEPIKREFPEVTYADLWSLAGTVAIEQMGGPEFKWRPGRKDFDGPKVELPGGLLPDADGRGKSNPADHLRDIFYRMGFNDREIVALSGAHALGRCHTDRSGFWGPWTRAPTTFSNEYFKLLLDEKWTPKSTHKGGPWKGPAQFEDKTGELMMLPTDLALVQDPKMRPIVEEYAKNEAVFFKDFAAAWIKLNELGVKAFHGTRRYYLFGPRE